MADHPDRIVNIFDSIPQHLPEELIDVLLQTKTVRIERIISTGQSSPEGFWYDQPEHEWVIVLQGKARLRLEGAEDDVCLNTGDSLNIPAGCRHRVSWTSPDETTIWLGVFYN